MAKNTKTRKCKVYYLPMPLVKGKGKLTKHKAFRISIYPGRDHGYLSIVRAVKDCGEWTEQTLETWEFKKRSPFLSSPA